MSTFILGIVPFQSANSALDNLAEADYGKVSIIMKDVNKARQLGDDTGPLHGVTISQLPEALKQRGISESKISAIQAALEKDAVCISFETPTPSVASAKEILQGADAVEIESV
jgi:hypothetical protein